MTMISKDRGERTDRGSGRMHAGAHAPTKNGDLRQICLSFVSCTSRAFAKYDPLYYDNSIHQIRKL